MSETPPQSRPSSPDPLSDATVDAFDLAGRLPTGRMVLRASAGTGKTYTIAGLATRYVAEGICELPQLLIVTFTRAAAAELRDRVRGRLVATRAHLDAVLGGAAAESDDVAMDLLARGDPAELQRRSERLATALADFDAATITTIHGFCQQVLTGLGLTADLDPSAALTEDVSGLLAEVVDDVLVARFAGSLDAPIKRQQLIELAATVVGNPGARIVPDPEAVEGLAKLRAELVAEVRDRFAARKHRQQVLSYDDLLTRLRDALVDPARGDAAVATLRRRYRIALIDEFQDTDPVQWDILGRAFSGPEATLVLIGDPKQAIYAFRGADVHAYLDAVASTCDHATLATSWRSDADLLTAFDTLFAGVTFGHPEIAHRPVVAAPGHGPPRLLLPDGTPPLRIRCLRRDQGHRGSQGDIDAAVARNHIVADITVQTVRLLEAGAVIVDRDRDGQETRRRALSCGDIAVLVRTNAEANLVQRALLDADVPAIINGVGSVFTTGAAADWRRLLEALEQPTSVGRVRAVALSSFLGWSAEQLAGANDDDLVPLHDELHGWVELLRDHGVASLLRTITVSQALPERVLARPDGERFLTDLHHIGELLHTAATSEQLGPTALAGWLRARIAEARSENVPPDERARRLESDDEAVQILTIHRSKGLEFPVVFAPFLSSSGRGWDAVPVFHDHGQRTIDVGGKGWEGFEDDEARSVAEQQGEMLRLLYVALTRARHHVVVWWAPVRKAGSSALGRVLFGKRDADGVVDTAGKAPIGNDDRLSERLHELVAPAEGRIGVEVSPATIAPVVWRPPDRDVAPLAAARLDRDIDRDWRRTSYSRLTDHTYHAAPVATEPDESVTDDEWLAPAAAVGEVADAAPTFTEGELRDVPLPLAEVGAGTAFGTFVHAILEEVDLAADDLDGELGRVIEEQRHRHPVDVHPDLRDGLVTAIETPLGPLTGDGFRLRDVTRGDRLDEMDFELPIGGGDAGGRSAVTHTPFSVAAVRSLLRAHLPSSDPLAGYADHLDDPAFHATVRGYLTGSIDLTLRVRDDAGAPRFLVVDHKTNKLGVPGAPLTAWDYRPAALADAMIHGHYPLQALLYQVALHRYLRWRQADYDPARHLGGALYLFLRGMVGKAGVIPGVGVCGVFAWTPPAGLITDLSDLLDGGSP